MDANIPGIRVAFPFQLRRTEINEQAGRETSRFQDATDKSLSIPRRGSTQQPRVSAKRATLGKQTQTSEP